MDVFVKRFESDSPFPRYATIGSAGFDICSYETKIIPPRGREKFRTGIAISWSDPNSFLQLHSRSGMFIQKGVTVEGGIIDYDFMQEIHVLLQNHADDPVLVEKGQRIAQGIFHQKSTTLNWFEGEMWSLDEKEKRFFPFSTLERNGGFGSTGK